ncbi:MAG: YidC/Oxa1 family insertase periplasmic-domain containing protein, partial [Planctomycetota bacterium]
MKMKTVGITVLAVFTLFCGWLIVDAVVHHPQQAKQLVSRMVPLASELNELDAAPAAVPAEIATETISNAPVKYPHLSAANIEEQTIKLGALYPELERSEDPEKYKFMVVLTSKGAAVRHLISSEFKARGEATSTEALSEDASDESKVLSPLSILQPFGTSGKEVDSLANTALKVAPAHAEQFDTKAFPLNKLNWKLVETDAKDQARFEATLKDANSGNEMLKVIKIYRVQPGSYDLACDIAVENLSGDPIKVLMQMQGPGGMEREGVRQDARKIKAAYQSSKNGVDVEALDVAAMQKKLNKNDKDAFKVRGKNAEDALLWSAMTNKYFAAIVRPVPTEAQNGPWLKFTRAQYYPAPTENKDDKDLQNCSYSMTSQPITLAAAGQDGAQKSYSLEMYVGPKDKKVFKKNDTYASLQYFKTIDFRGCCCPQNVIAPMAFGIIWLMNSMYTLMGPLGNYGVVIMCLVFLVRLLMHPVTKKSQVSMVKMQKLGPKMKEIQAKYANNKAEMNKQVMAMYREQGVSPVSSMLPMMLQMPIWIALWTAVYTSIDL